MGIRNELLPACAWCGDRHAVEALCARAQRGMTRRSFLFLTTAAVIGAALPTLPSYEVQLVEQTWQRGVNPHLGRLVAEEWNRIIGAQLADNMLELPIQQEMRQALRKRLGHAHS